MDLCSFCSFPLNNSLQSWFTMGTPPPRQLYPVFPGPSISDSSLFPNQNGTIVTLTWEVPPMSVVTGERGHFQENVIFPDKCLLQRRVMNPIFWFWACTSQQKPGTQTPPWKQKLSTDDTGVNTLEKWVDSLAAQFGVLKTNTWAVWLHKSNDVLNKTASTWCHVF